MRILSILLIVLGMAAVLAGCANYTTRPPESITQLTPAQKEFEATWRATRQVLRKYNFTLTRQDRRAGVILTEPMVGKYLSEPWRHDAATRRDLAEGTIQKIYRQAKVTVRPIGPGGGDFDADVKVVTFRSNRQELQVSSASEAFSLFDLTDDEDRQRRLLDYGQNAAEDDLVLLGRDSNLEEKITAKILTAKRDLKGRL